MRPTVVESEDAQVTECGDAAETPADLNRLNRGAVGVRKAVPAPAYANEVLESNGGCQHPIGCTCRAEFGGVRNACTSLTEDVIP
jgi:hypothetical protein